MKKRLCPPSSAFLVLLAGLCLLACDEEFAELSDTDDTGGFVATGDDGALADVPLDQELAAAGGEQHGIEPGPPLLFPTDGIVGVAIANSTDRAYAWTRANTVSAGMPEQLASHRSPYRFFGASGSEVVDTAIASNDRTYVWLSDGTAGRGSTANPTSVTTWTYHLPGGRQPSDIAGIAIRKSNDQTHAYYADGTYSRGNTSWLGSASCCSPYSLPSGKTPADIVGMDFDSQDRLHTWYDDDTYSIGTAWDLDWYQEPRRYARHGILASMWPPGAPPVVAPAPDWPPPVDVEPYDGIPSLAPPAETFDLPSLGKSDDLLVAAGRDAIGLALAASVYFYDKSGNPLTGGGLEANGRLPLEDMFAEFERKGPLRAGAEPSPLDVNQYLGFEKSCSDPSYPATNMYAYCVASTPYDTRIHYDPKGGRFVILANLRNSVWSHYYENQYKHPELSDEEVLAIDYNIGRPDKDPLGQCGYYRNTAGDTTPLPDEQHCKLGRRVRAVAISRTSDPRDGFYTYVLLENSYRDWPWMAVDEDWAILSARGANHPQASAVTLLSLADLRQGKVRPQYINYRTSEFDGRLQVIPPQQVGSLPGHSLLASVEGDQWWFFGLPHPTVPYAKQSPGMLTVSLSDAPDFSRERAVYRHGILHLPHPVETKISDEIRQSEVQYVRLPLWLSGKQPHVSTSEALGYQKRIFAHPNVMYRRDEPIVAVNGAGESLIAWGHSGVFPGLEEPPRVEHTLWPNGASNPDLRSIFRAGDGYAPGYPADKIKAIAASVDPVDDRTFWVVHKYGTASGGWGLVIGSVDPTQ